MTSPTNISESSDRLPTGAVARRYGVTQRSVDRWLADETLNFPKPLRICGRKYFLISELEKWERQRAKGQWLPWLRDYCHIPERTARLYIQLAIHAEELKSATLPISINGAVAFIAKKQKEERVVLMKERRSLRELELAERTVAASQVLGKKLYGVIYADPPWLYNNPPMGDVARQNEQHYPTMPLDKIKALRIPAADDCVLFLWATVPLLPEAIEVMRAWGFTYKSASTWVKDKAGTGYWVRGVVEHLLIGRRGDVPSPAPGDQFPGFIEAPRGRHSEKPDIFAEEIVRLYPNVPRLEMFARAPHFDWDSWGNEVVPTSTPLSPASNVAPVEPKLERSVKQLFLAQAQKSQKAYRMDRALKWRRNNQQPKPTGG
jgi:N6-adenosine-specific RNA methylase IME4/predicted DNA-binding transcriptional regulator AlpA